MDDDFRNGNVILPEDNNRQLTLPSEMTSRGLQLAARIELQRNIEKYQKPIRYFPGFDERSRINFSRNGGFAAIYFFLSIHGDLRNTDLLIWDVNTGSTTMLSKKMHGMNLGTICSAALSSSGEMALTSYQDAIVLLWDVKNKQVVKKFKIDDTAPVSRGVLGGLNFSPDDKYFAAGNFYNVTVRETRSGKEMHRLRAMIDTPNEMAFSDDGSKLVIGNTYWSEKDFHCHNMYLVDIKKADIKSNCSRRLKTYPPSPCFQIIEEFYR